MGLEEFETRARSAEERIKLLENKLLGGSQEDKNVAELLAIREQLMIAKEQIATAEKERDEVVQKLKSLQKDVLKLQYQTLHLKRAVQENDKKIEQLQS